MASGHNGDRSSHKTKAAYAPQDIVTYSSATDNVGILCTGPVVTCNFVAGVSSNGDSFLLHNDPSMNLDVVRSHERTAMDKMLGHLSKDNADFKIFVGNKGEDPTNFRNAFKASAIKAGLANDGNIEAYTESHFEVVPQQTNIAIDVSKINVSRADGLKRALLSEDASRAIVSHNNSRGEDFHHGGRTFHFCPDRAAEILSTKLVHLTLESGGQVAYPIDHVVGTTSRYSETSAQYQRHLRNADAYINHLCTQYQGQPTENKEEADARSARIEAGMKVEAAEYGMKQEEMIETKQWYSILNARIAAEREMEIQNRAIEQFKQDMENGGHSFHQFLTGQHQEAQAQEASVVFPRSSSLHLIADDVVRHVNSQQQQEEHKHPQQQQQEEQRPSTAMSDTSATMSAVEKARQDMQKHKERMQQRGTHSTMGPPPKVPAHDMPITGVDPELQRGADREKRDARLARTGAKGAKHQARKDSHGGRGNRGGHD